jgi:hypothetical protein
MKKIRWFPAILGGFLSGLGIYFLVSFFASTPQVWALFVGWILVGYWAGIGQQRAWGRIWLVLCIISFAMPIAAFALGANITADAVNSSGSEAEQAGAVIGGAIGTTLLTGVVGVISFFLGIIFAILAYFKLRSPKSV